MLESIQIQGGDRASINVSDFDKDVWVNIVSASGSKRIILSQDAAVELAAALQNIVKELQK